ncbi:MAG: histidine kinase [Muribaculaceae bacterium]|nr:histidine kinase [Muribaculaceae bacterium]
MTNGKTLLLIILAFILSNIILLSCIHNSKDDNNNERDNAIIVAQHFSNSVFTNPQNVIDTVTAYQSKTKDSISFYTYELLRSMSYLCLGDFDKCNSTQKHIYKFLERNNHLCHYLEGGYWNNRALIERFTRMNIDSAISFYNKSYEHYLLAKDAIYPIDVAINLADIYRDKGDLAKAANIYQRALFVNDSIGKKISYNEILIGLGQVYCDLKNFGESQKYFDRAITKVDTMPIYSRFLLYNSIGNNYYFQEKYDSAIVAFKKAKAISTEMDNPYANAICICNLGESYMFLNNLDSAAAYLTKEMPYFNSYIANQAIQSYYESLMTDFYLRKNDLVNANKYITRYHETKDIVPRYRAMHYRRIERYYIKINDFREAYKYQVLAKGIEDSISNTLINNQIAEIKSRYIQDTTLLNRNHTIISKEKQITNLTWISSIVFLLLFVTILLIIFIYQNNKRKAELKEMANRSSLASLRLQNIRNRVSPHFIFNILNRELTVSNEGVSNLVLLLRKNLELCDKFCITLKEEIDFVNTYIANEVPSLGDNFILNKNIDSNVDLDNTPIPSMMIQIFVENAIKHGLRGYSGNKRLYIGICSDENNTIIKISNNGNTQHIADPASSTHTGLKVVMQTIQILNEKNINKIDLKINEVNSGEETEWIVVLSIPHNYNFDILKD